MARRLTGFSFVLLLVLGTATAQPLASVLPQETIFAVGTEGIASHADKLEPIIAEAERLELGQAFRDAFGYEDELSTEVPEELGDLAPLDLVGQEAWLTVSISDFNPLPALTAVSRVSGGAADQLGASLEEAAAQEGATTLTEGDVTIYQFPLDSEDEGSPFQVMAVARSGDVFVLSTNPEVLRGVLRRLAGANEPGFTDSEGYRVALDPLGSGNVYFYLDMQRLAGALRPLANGTGYDQLIQRALAGLETFGQIGSVTTIERDGFSSSSLRLPGTGDEMVMALLSGQEPASREPLDFVSPDALGVQVTSLDIPAWWDYLSDVARSSDELGNPELDQMITQFTGIDIRTALLDWMGDGAATITGDLGAPVQPGVPSENLLGNAVYMIETTDEQAASQGLSMLFGMVGGMVAGFADPTGAGAPQVAQRVSSGVQVTSYNVAPGVHVGFAVTDGWVLISTSEEGMDAALAARASGTGIGGVLGRLVSEVPDEATSYAVSDVQQTLEQTGAQMAAQVQMFAGMTGGDIDFQALEQAGAAIQEFFSFLAQRAGGSVTYTVPEGAGVFRGHGMTEFDW
ncbi:MAG TPA: hypothetical protein VF168_12055 [Trueperaceae bacterium]